MTEWKPIETAPKDETSILAAVDDRVTMISWHENAGDERYTGWCEARYENGGVLYDLVNVLYGDPTHWMPLPSPPNQP